MPHHRGKQIGYLSLAVWLLAACSNGDVTFSTSGGTGTTISGSTGSVTSSGTAGATSSGNGTSTGTTGNSTTSGTSGCPDGGSLEFGQCATDKDCACPFSCVSDVGIGARVCEEKGCNESAECPDPLSFCSAGVCSLNFCVANIAGNVSPGTFGLPCDSWDAGSGTCIAQGANLAGSQSGFCIQGGTVPVGSACLPLQLAPYPDPATQADVLCAVGAGCIMLPDGGGECLGVGDGGCIVGLGAAAGVPNTEFLTCGSSTNCQCPSVCVTDPAVGGFPVCESACASNANCPLAVEKCPAGGGSCTLDFCAADFQGHVAPGMFNGSCGPGDAGNCIATPASQSRLAGICIQTGTAGTHAACDPNFSKGDGTLLCGPGLWCVGGTAAGGFVCQALCDPSTDGGTICGTNEQCTDYTGGIATTIGFCCLPSDAGCAADQACCSGACATNRWCS
jgi:hypothetical protein